MRVWYDAEFSTTAPDIGLVSLGAVAEDGREFYGVSTEFDPDGAHPWVKANVLPQLPPPGDPAWMTRVQLREALLAPGERQVLLSREVVEDRLLRDVGGDRDLGDGDGVEAALGKQPAGGRGNRLPSDALLAGPEAFGLCA